MEEGRRLGVRVPPPPPASSPATRETEGLSVSPLLGAFRATGAPPPQRPGRSCTHPPAHVWVGSGDARVPWASEEGLASGCAPVRDPARHSTGHIFLFAA